MDDGYVLYLHERENKGLRDYKVYCFNGKAQFLYLSQGLENHATARINYVTLNWKPARYRRNDYKEFEELPPKPKQLEKMISLAEILTRDLTFCRVDFYELHGKVYFGEMTFSPGSGFTPFKEDNMDLEIGKYLKIENIKRV